MSMRSIPTFTVPASLFVVAEEPRDLHGRALRHEHEVHPHLHGPCLALPHHHGAHVAVLVHHGHAEGLACRPVHGVEPVQSLEEGALLPPGADLGVHGVLHVVPVMDKYSDMGTMVMGKSEA